jgi:hypothetical protein
VEAAAVVRHLDAELLSSQSRVDADMARARMAASVDERLADDAEDFCPPPPQRTGRHSVCDVQKDLAIDGRLPVDFDERGEELSEWPVLLAAQPAARRSRPATAGPPSKQRPYPSQPLRCLWVSQIRARTSCLGQGVGQILERLVVEVASRFAVARFLEPGPNAPRTVRPPPPWRSRSPHPEGS